MKGWQRESLVFTQHGGENDNTFYMCDVYQTLGTGNCVRLFLNRNGFMISEFEVMKVDKNDNIAVDSSWMPESANKTIDAHTLQVSDFYKIIEIISAESE